MEHFSEPTANERQALELGIVIGQRRAFGMVAGRCSAAQAECLRKVKEEKLYVRFAASWDEYCVQVLKMSRRNADRVVALLKKHGVLYFEVAALTGIAPAEYERIEPAVRADGIHVDSEVIALIPANTERIVEAVARLQAEARPTPESTASKQISELQKRGHQLAKAFRKIAKSADDVERSILRGSVEGVARDLSLILAEYSH
jgi:hypothetical protein